MKRLILVLICAALPLLARAQTVIQMVEDLGVYKVPCEVNGLKVKMVFDTGAASVTISSSLAEMMLDNGFLSTNDIGNKAKSITADGRIVDHTRINLKSIKIGDIVLSDVDAVVVDNQRAPLLFGQSAIQRLGEVSIKGDKLFIKGKKGSDSTNDMYERWDAKNYTYSNFTYGFGWKLPEDLKWEREQGEEQHTPFRVTGGPFLVFVNAQVSHGGADLWDIFPKLGQMVEAADEALEKKTGKMTYERTWEKCSLFGQHAIKTTFKEYFKDSRFDKAEETYAEEYFLIHNGYTLVVAAKVNKEVYDQVDCTGLFKQIFQGFSINSGR